MEMIKLTCLLLLWTAFAKANASTYVPCDNCVDKANTSVLANISLRIYPNATIDQYEAVLVGNVSNLCDKMDTSKPTVLYIFGWTETPDSTSVQTVIGAYLERDDHNIMLVDWQVIAAYPYLFSALSANGVGYTVAKALNNLSAAACLDWTTLHVVGHSLGARISGFVGGNADFKVPRITGLDPAGPGYYFVIEELTSADAKFVDVIHTDQGVFGTANNTGTVNFYPNGGGSPQPGCLSSGTLADICSHARSWTYYAESLLLGKAFVGLKCNSYISFSLGLCNSGKALVMGYETPTSASGNFFLQTNGASPYGRGAAGETYSGKVSLQNTLF